MKSIAIVSQKGGAGKTTVCVHLAVAAQLAGHRVAIIDTDPQRSAATWADTREAEDPVVVAIDASQLTEALAEAQGDGYDVVFVDSEPRAAPIAAATVRAVDFALVPVRPSAFDLATADQTQRIVVAAGKPGAFILNGCPTRAPEVAEARAMLSALGIPLLNVELGDRRAYGRAVQTGRSVQEFDPKGAAAEEIGRAWTAIERRLK
jgi:chromosome partitioning protein